MPHLVIHWRRFRAVWLLPVLLLLGCASAARAQGVGFQGGATLDPGQGFVGTHFETGELVPGLRFRPGIDGAYGGGFSLATINLEFLYSIPMRSGWAIYQGGGPAIVLERDTVGTLHTTSTHAGTILTFGFAHESGFFTEFKLGGGYSPRLKFAVGYTIRKKKP
jgi:hypothetical protein